MHAMHPVDIRPASSEVLHASWSWCWQSLALEADGTALRDALLHAYDAPHRRYHTRQHLAECLSGWTRWRAHASAPAEAGLALWFHDAVYDLRATDNEARSAEWAARALTDAGASEGTVARIRSHVLATCHAAEPGRGDESLVVDIDLAILAAPRERFTEYEAQVREEYGWVPGFLFRRKRRAVLQAFLARPAIYATPELHDAMEADARENLRWSIARLGG